MPVDHCRSVVDAVLCSVRPVGLLLHKYTPRRMHDLRMADADGIPAPPRLLIVQCIVHVFQSSKVAWQSRFVENVAIDGIVHVHLMHIEPDAFSGTRRKEVRFAKASRADGQYQLTMWHNLIGAKTQKCLQISMSLLTLDLQHRMLHLWFKMAVW